MKINEKNMENIELKDTKENNQINDFEMQNLNRYFQIIDLKKLESYENLITEEINNSDTLFGNNYFKYFMKNKLLTESKCFKENPKKLGNLYVYLFIKNQPLFTIGTKKLSLVIIYQIFLNLSFILIHLGIIQNVFSYMRFMLSLFYSLNLLNHMYIFLINPGIPSPEKFSKKVIKTIKKEDRKYFEVCEICNIITDYKDEVRHCNECNICIKKIDHHCSWTGKCIAKNNYLAFHLFTFSLLLYYVWYAIIIVVWCIIKIAEYKHKI